MKLKINDCLLMIIVLLLINSKNAYSQSIEGRYKDNLRQSIDFKANNMVEFLIIRSTGMGPCLAAGKGKYKLKKNKLIINVGNDYYNIASLSKYNFISKEKDSLTTYAFKFFNTNNKPIDNIPFYCSYISYKKMYYEFIGTGAEIKLEKLPDDSLISIGNLLYEKLLIKIENNRSGIFNVFMHEGSFQYVKDFKLELTYKLIEDTLIFSSNGHDFYKFQRIYDKKCL